jgi:uroporphyrinogen III methyltransferase/synthase
MARLAAMLPEVRFEEVGVSSPGDRDLVTDLRASPPDFFTRDLDDRVRSGEITMAIHSAKDLPDPMPEGIDWFWLPWREDPRDGLMRPPGLGMDTLPANARIGVSSGRREEYCRRRFPDARLLNIRGNIEERIRQLDDGQYDLIVMAGAGLNRIGLQNRITEWIPTTELPPPAGQGYLAVTFKAGDATVLRIRSLFVKAVTFAAAGVGSAGTCTLENLRALEQCDVCIHDVLMGPDLPNYIPPHVELIDVGKRCGHHSVPQPEITHLITIHARRGRRVARLKGGDPGVFGRLAEEVEALDRLHLPYRALPGVSSLTAATTTTGMLLTRRGVSRGFCVMTPRAEGGTVASVGGQERTRLPMVFYMSVSVAGQVADQLMAEGMAADTPAAVVFGGGGDQAYTVTAPLSRIGQKATAEKTDLPGLLIIGEAARYHYETDWGALQGQRVLLTASESLQNRAIMLVNDFGGVPVSRPLIRLTPSPEGLAAVRRVKDFDWVVLTSPSAVRCFGELLREAKVDLRSVPKLITCGGGTSQELLTLGLRADIEPASNFSAEGLLAVAVPQVKPGLRILRLRSDKAGDQVADALRARGAAVEDCVLYHNKPISYDQAPVFTSVFFASASAVEVFESLWGMERLRGKTVVAIGKPTLAALEKRGVSADLVPPEATVESSITALAVHCINQALKAART